MRFLGIILLILILFASCKTNKATANSDSDSAVEETQDTIRIANDELEYEVIIIEAGFDSWMLRRARPKTFYTQSFLEAKNIPYVSEWNRRVISSGFNSNLYEMQINYSQGIDYGFDVNYMLYHYFAFFEEKYNQKLTAHNPRF